MEKKYTYTQGMIDMAKIFGTVCDTCVSCDKCNVGIVKGADLSCMEFARQFPKKFVSLLVDQYQEGLSYFDEYILRFPQSTMDVDTLVELGICRKAIFEGYLECELLSSECKRCWLETYEQDVSKCNLQENMEHSSEKIRFCVNCGKELDERQKFCTNCGTKV